MSDTIKVRLRGTAYHNGQRFRPGEIIDFHVEDMIEGRLPSWAEAVPGVTDMAVLAKHINAGDARQIANDAKRRAEREQKQADAAKAKADKEAKEAAAAEAVAKAAEAEAKKQGK